MGLCRVSHWADTVIAAVNELAALKVAIEKSRANKRGIPHEEMRLWLLELAASNFDAPPPAARDL